MRLHESLLSREKVQQQYRERTSSRSSAASSSTSVSPEVGQQKVMDLIDAALKNPRWQPKNKDDLDSLDVDSLLKQLGNEALDAKAELESPTSVTAPILSAGGMMDLEALGFGGVKDVFEQIMKTTECFAAPFGGIGGSAVQDDEDGRASADAVSTAKNNAVVARPSPKKAAASSSKISKGSWGTGAFDGDSFPNFMMNFDAGLPTAPFPFLEQSDAERFGDYMPVSRVVPEGDRTLSDEDSEDSEGEGEEDGRGDESSPERRRRGFSTLNRVHGTPLSVPEEMKKVK